MKSAKAGRFWSSTGNPFLNIVVIYLFSFPLICIICYQPFNRQRFLAHKSPFSRKKSAVTRTENKLVLTKGRASGNFPTSFGLDFGCGASAPTFGIMIPKQGAWSPRLVCRFPIPDSPPKFFPSLRLFFLSTLYLFNWGKVWNNWPNYLHYIYFIFYFYFFVF